MLESIKGPLTFIGIILVLGGAATLLENCSKGKVMEQTKKIDTLIVHRNDTMRIIDTITKYKKQKIQLMTTPEVENDFDSVFAVDTVHDTIAISVGQAKKCLELAVTHDGDSAKLNIDNRTIDGVQVSNDKIKAQAIVPAVAPHNYTDFAIGAGVAGVAFFLLKVFGG